MAQGRTAGGANYSLYRASPLEDEAPGVSIRAHLVQAFVDLRERVHVHRHLDFLLGDKLQHLLDQLGAADVAARKEEILHDRL